MNDNIMNMGLILQSFLNPDPNIRQPNENKFFELLKNDPNSTINILFAFILQTPSCSERKQALICANRFLYKIDMSKQTQVLVPETYQNIISTITKLLQVLNIDQVEIQYVFLIIRSLIRPIIIPGLWPNIYSIMWSLGATNLASYVISFFAEFVSSFKMDNISQIPQELIQQISQLVKFDYPDPKASVSAISLAFKLISLNSEYMQILSVIPQAICQLPDQLIDESIAFFGGFFQMNWSQISNYANGFLATFLQIAQDSQRLESCRISSLERLDIMLSEAPYVRKFFDENLNIFLQTLSVCFMLNDKNDTVYTSACVLLEDYVSDKDTKKTVLSQISKSFANLPVPVVSVFIRYLPDVHFINQIIQFAQSPDPVVSQNAFETIDILLDFNYQKLVKQNPNIAQILSNLLFGLVDQGRAEAVYPLARLAESLASYNKEKLRVIAPRLLTVWNKILNSDSIRCAAAVAEAFPNEVSANALNLANISMKKIIEGTDADSTYALMISVSTFAKCMQPNDLSQFIQQLMTLITQVPAISMSKGLRIIAKQIGEQFAQFLPVFIPYLIKISTQFFDMAVLKDTEYSGDSRYLDVSFGSNIFSYQIEEMMEKANALESLSDYLNAVKGSFAPFFDQTVNAAKQGIDIIFDTQIRIAAINLFSSLANCFPQHIPQIFALLLEKIVTKGEPVVEVQQAIMSALQEIVLNKQCPKEVRVRYMQIIPGILANSITEIRKGIESGDFSMEQDSYLNLLWSVAIALKTLYETDPQESGASFIQISRILLPFNQETVLLLNQFSMAIWTDFLIYGPENYVSQCEAMVQQVMQMVNCPDPDIRRMALYAIGRIFEKRNLPPSELDKIFGVLYISATSESAQNDETLFEGNDNALSSYALLLKKRIPMGNSAELIKHFLEMFPAEDDLDEVPIAYDFLFELLWQAGNNQEIALFIQPIVEKLHEGLQIEVVNKIVKSVIEEKMKQGNPPPQVAQFLSMIQ